MELINSDRILDFHLKLAFYVSVFLLLWNLTITALLIYSEFIKLYYSIIRYGNLILYMGFTVGFYLDYNYRKQEE